MKAYPPHYGHFYLIDTALSICDKVNVMICYNESQSIPGEVRYKSMLERYGSNNNVIIHLVSDDGLPQHDWECDTLDEFYSYWVPLVYKNIDILDVVFTSEDYGDDFARYLGVKHHLVDKLRVNYPVSGTSVRSNPYLNWNFINNEIKKYYMKRIVIMGPESVGKSTLTEKLSNYYNTNFVCEWGRKICEDKGGNLSLVDFIRISKERQQLEDNLIKYSNKMIFCDTEDITTYLFSKMYYPSEYKLIEKFFKEKLKKSKKYDLYILLKPDCESFQDGTRKFINDRLSHYEIIKSELESRDCNFVEIGGDWDSRFNQSVKIIDKLFNI
jgi:HTH-type transcriptional regulator, transcriptional repressor of NAD biosynthesis genes